MRDKATFLVPAAPRAPRLLRVLLVALLTAAALVPVGAVGAAHAATIDGGTLTAGVPVTASPDTSGDTFVYRIAVPAGRVLTVLAAQEPTTVTALLNVRDDATSVQVTSAFLSPNGGTRFVAVPADTVARTLRLELNVFASPPDGITFTPDLVTDPAPVPVTFGSPATLTVAIPGQTATATFRGVAGHRMGISVTAVPPALGSSFRAQVTGGGDVVDLSGLPSTGSLMMKDTDYTVTVSASGQATGTLTVRVDDIQDVTGTVVFGASTTVALDTVWTQARLDVPQVDGARLAVEVLTSTLARADGTPGIADVALVDPVTGFSDSLGTVFDQPVRLVLRTPMTGSGTRTLTIVPDGASTGTLVLRVSAVPDNPVVPLPTGGPVTVSLPVANTTARYAFSAVYGQVLHLKFSGPAFTAPVTVGVRRAGVDSGFFVGGALSIDQLQPAATLDWTAAESGDFVLFVDPAGGTGSMVMNAALQNVVRLPLDAGVPLTHAVGSDEITVLESPGGGPDAPAPTVVLSALAGVGSDAPAAVLTLVQDGLPVSSLLPVTDVTALPVAVAGFGLDPARPWQLVVSGAVSSFTVTWQVASATTVPVTLDTPMTLDFVTPNDVRSVAIPAQPAGRRVVVKVLSDPTQVQLDLTAADGTALSGSGTDYVDSGNSPAQPMALVVHRVASNPGSVTVLVTTVTDPVRVADGRELTRVPFSAGQNPRVVVEAKRGQRLTFDVSAASNWTPADDLHLVDVDLLDPSGAFVERFSMLRSATPGLYATEAVLARSGRYTLVVDPQGAAAGRFVVAVRTVQDVVRKARLGQPAAITIARPGQAAVVRVTVPQGAFLGWTATFDGGISSGTFSLRDASGTVLSRQPLAATGTFPGPLPAGAYTVTVDPEGRQTGKVTLALATL